MGDRMRTWGRYAYLAALFLLISVPALLILFGFLLISIIVVLLSSIPAWVGKLFPIDDWIRAGVNRWLDIQRMQMFRDDMLQIFARQFDIDENTDRDWMLQEMGNATDRVDKQLRNGRIAVALTGAGVSITFAFVKSAQYAGILITVFGLIISLASFVRVVIIEILAYDPEQFLEYPHKDIAFRMGWNRGPINGRGAILVALATVVVGIDDRGYQLGKWVLEEVLAGRFSDADEKWAS